MSVRNVLNLAELTPLTSAAKLTVVDFFATWCGPCKAIAPHFANLAAQKTNVNFVKVDVDKSRDIAQQYQIRAMPTFIFFKNGRVIETIEGADWGRIQSLVETHGTAPLAAIPDDATLEKMSVKELMAIMKERHINTTGLIERADLVSEIKKYK